MTHGSLFSGIGGFDLAAEWAGWDNIFHCEWNPFGQRVLKHHFPKSISYEDITKTDFSVHRGSIDVISGGFPCQPYSSAGKRLGTADERHLWPHMLRTIREVQPGWVVGENVRGLTNWNGGVVFDEVQADLEAEGYEVTPFLLPACAVNAPHRRDRIWFVAYSNSNGHDPKSKARDNTIRQNNKQSRTQWKCASEGLSNESNATNPKNIGQEYALEDGELERGRFRKSNQRNFWDSFPSQSPICGGDDGLPKELDNITFPKWRNESIKAYGNAIVPQVAYQLFKTINSYENQIHH
jgi:DNA (cytosine-5)-methyltransferase 1